RRPGDHPGRLATDARCGPGAAPVKQTATARNAVLHWCQTHPIGTLLLSLALVSLGVIAFFRLPVAPLPEADFPTLQVSARLPGASPDTIASSVAAPLEVQFSAVAGITEMTSTSALGSVSIVLQFSLET